MSTERSGSNLLARLIGTHPDICAPSPAHLFRIFANNLFRYGNLIEDESWHALVSDLVHLADSKLGNWRSRLDVNDLLALVPERSLGALLKAIYFAEVRAQGRRQAFVKENQLYEFFGFLETAFQEARYVYLVRDPRDVALSWKHSTALRGGIMRAAKTWQQDQQGFLRMASWLDRRLCAVRYETLVSDPPIVLGQLCDFLGTTFSQDMLDFHRANLVRRDAAQVADWQNIARPILTRNFGKYQATLSDGELYYIEAVCHVEMCALGYVPTRFDGSIALPSLEQRLREQEPMEKCAYASVSSSERKRRDAWTAASQRVLSRAFAKVPR